MDNNRVSSVGLFVWGYDYLKAANILLRTGSDDVLYPRLFLYSHAIELGLKAFIFDKSGNLDRTHDLVKLVDVAKTLGFTPSDTFQSISKTFQVLNNDDYRVRYFKTGFMSFPNNQVLFEETKTLYEFLIAQISDPHRIIERKINAKNN